MYEQIYSELRPGTTLRTFGTIDARGILIALQRENLNVSYEDNETHGGIPVLITRYSFGSWELDHVISKVDSEWYCIELRNMEKNILDRYESEKYTPMYRNKFNTSKLVYDMCLAVRKAASVKQEAEQISKRNLSNILTEQLNKMRK